MIPPTGLTIGREVGNDLLLTDPLVSRHHAFVGYRDETLYISDLGSYNGTLINGERVTKEQAFHDGDVLEIGDTRLTLYVQVPQPSIAMPAVAAPAYRQEPSAVIPLIVGEPVGTVVDVAPEAPARLAIAVSAPEPGGAAAQLALRGVLDMETADQFEDATRQPLEAGAVHFTLVLDELGYLDSSGLGALVALFRAVKPHGGSVQLVGPQLAVREIIELTRLDRIFAVR